jgi:hypothetical protein
MEIVSPLYCSLTITGSGSHSYRPVPIGSVNRSLNPSR